MAAQSSNRSSFATDDDFPTLSSSTSNGGRVTASTSVSSLTDAATWVPPRSPPTPPYPYDPRLRAASPETPSPLEQVSKRPKYKRSAHSLAKPSPNGSSVRVITTESIEEDASLPYAPAFHTTTKDQPSLHPPPPRLQAYHPESASFTQSFSHFQPAASTSSSSGGQATSSTLPSYSALSFLKRRIRKESVSLPKHSPPLQFARPKSPPLRFSKLSRLRDPASNGKSKVKPPSRHAHKRSYSVQWQQFDRWQSNSVSRLRNIFLLVVFILVAAIIIYKVCVVSISSPAKPDSRSYTNSPRGGVDLLPPHFQESQRNTLVLYRILGNDLPPRHGEGQTLRNVRFMLEQENDFSFLAQQSSSYGLRVEKYYVLNRLTSNEAKTALLQVFAEFNVPKERILEIPFDWEEYRQKALRWDGGVTSTDNMWGVGAPARNIAASLDEDPATDGLAHEERKEKQARWETMAKLRAMEYTLHDKNVYAINNNGGRNFALDHGRSLPHARWVFPLDGNCFFTPASMTSVFQTLAKEGEGINPRHHVVIPMVRLVDNNIILPDNHLPFEDQSDADPIQAKVSLVEAPEEPQVGFRWDTQTLYQPAMRYGRRPKLELLWRLGAVSFSKGLHLRKLPWESSDRTYITPHTYGSLVLNHTRQVQTEKGISNGDFSTAGWVNRLFSGERSQEESTPQASELRRLNRMKGIVAYLEKLDERIVQGLETCQEPEKCGFKKDRLWNWDAQVLKDLRNGARSEEPEALQKVLRFEEDTLTVFEKAEELKSRLKLQKEWDALNANDIAINAARLAIAGYISSNLTYSAIAADLIQARFLPNATVQIKYGQPRVSLDRFAAYSSNTNSHQQENVAGYAFPLLSRIGNPLVNSLRNDVVLRYDAFNFEPSVLLDALRLLSPQYQPTLSLSNILPPKQLRTTFSTHLRMLLLSTEGMELSRSPSSWEAALLLDTQVATLAGYLNEAKLLTRVANRHKLRFVEPETGEDSGNRYQAAAAMGLPRFYRGFHNLGYPLQLSEHDIDQTVESLFDL